MDMKENKYKEIYLTENLHANDLFDNFFNLINYEKAKKTNSKFANRQKVENMLTSVKLLSSPEKQTKTIAGRRALEKLFALSIINEKERVLANNDEISFNFPVSMNSYPEYVLEKNSSGVDEFFKSHNEEDIFEFFLRNFGCEYSSRDYRYRAYDSAYDTGWFLRKGSINYDRIIEHCLGFNVIQSKHYEHSKIATIEISSKQNQINYYHYLSLQDMATVVSHEFGCKPFFIERSLNKQGVIRLYFLFDSYIPNKQRLELENYFRKNYGFSIKVQKDEDFMTLPFSKETMLFGSYDESLLLSVKQETMTETFDRLSKGLTANKVRPLENLIGKIKYGETIESSMELYNCQGSSTPDKFAYGRGTRYKNQNGLALHCCAKGKSLNEYISLACSLNDGTSKDMKNWNTMRTEHELTKYYEYATSIATPYQAGNLINPDDSKTYYLDEDGTKVYSIKDTDIYTSLNTTFVKKQFLFIINYFYNQKYKKKRQQGKWKEHFIKDILALCKFLERKLTYKKQINKKYKDKKYEKLDEGISIPVGMYKSLKKFLNIKTSMSKLFTFLKDIGLLKPIYIDGYEYSFKNDNYAKHFILFNEKLIHDKVAIINVYINNIKKLVKNSLKINQNTYLYYVNYFHSALTKMTSKRQFKLTSLFNMRQLPNKKVIKV